MTTTPLRSALTALLLFSLAGATGCSDSDDPGTVTPPPCGGACPAEQCFAGTCIGNNGTNNGVNNGESDAGDTGDEEVLEGCGDSSECEDGQYCAIPDGEERGECADGCDDDDDCNGALVCRDHACVAGCEEDTNCAGDEYCADIGTCVEGCRDDNSCDDGFSCTDVDTEDGPRQRCEPTVCATIEDCPDGFACDNTSCAPGCTEDSCDDGELCDPATLLCVPGCDDDDACEDGTYCDLDSGMCLEGCRTDDSCGDGFACTDNDCVPGPCDFNSHCAEGYFCDDGTCAEGCRDDDGCESDQVCDAGRCRNGCRVDDACQPDEYCQIGDDDNYGDCERGCRIGGCGEDQICNRSTRACQDAGCGADAECGDGLICEAEVCVEGCRVDGTCGDGQICEDDNCIAGCRGDDGCADTEICEDLTCITGCRDDDGCADAEICVDLGCVTGCRIDGDCGDGQICEALSCIAGCRGDGDCAFGQVCTDLTCEAGCRDDDGCDDDDYCDIDDQQDAGLCETGCRQGGCPLGQICDLEARMCQEEPCEADAECPLGRICNDGDCDLGCRQNDQRCAEGQICDLDSDFCVVGCRNDEQCDDGEYCTDALECAVGCSVDDQCGDGEICTDNACVGGCREDEECEGLEVCTDNVCAVATCERNDDCPDNAYCEGQTCALGCRDDNGCEPAEICTLDDHTCRIGCRVDVDCADDEYCSPGTLTCETGCRFGDCPGIQECDEDARTCRNPLCDVDADCTLDRFCDGDTCELGCRGDFNCAQGEVCIENACVEGCRNDGNCDVGEYCDPDALSCVAGCRNDPDCGDGEICADNACVAGCRSDFECADQEYCDGAPAGACATGCRPFACPNGQVCDINSRDCVDAPDPNCELDADCPDQQVCDTESFVCRPGCRSDDDCQADEICPGFQDPNRQCRLGCRDDDSCPANQYCSFAQDNICVNGCRNDLDCNPGESCREVEFDGVFIQQCVADTCENDGDCDDALYCDLESELCRPGCRPEGCDGNDLCDLDTRECVEGPCEADGDCNAPDEICVDTQCVPGCRGDVDCGVGELCDLDRLECVAGCRDDETCRDEEFCSIAPRDEVGSCQQGCREGGCPDGQLCDPRDRLCVESECLADEDCADEEYCRDEIECLVGCRGDDACADGEVCTDIGHECVLGCRGEDGDDGVCEGVQDTPVQLDLGETIELAGAVCLEDTDHVAVELGAGEGLSVAASLLEDRGTVELAVLDGCGAILASESGDLNVFLNFVAPFEGQFTLRIRGATPDDTNEYTALVSRRPAVCDDDSFDGEIIEPNDTFDTAADLGVVAETPLTADPLRICANDEDWYAVEVTAPGQRIAATVMQSPDDAPLTIEIFLDDGRIRLAVADGPEASKTAATQALNQVGTYLVRVSPQVDPGLGAGTRYSLRLLLTESACVPDPHEPNDDPDFATPTPTGQTTAAICGGDDDQDWYRFQVRPGDSVNVEVTYDHGALDGVSELPITLYGPGGADDVRDFLVRVGDSDTDGLFQAPDGFVVGEGDAGQWFLSVGATGANGELPYVLDLTVESPSCEGEQEDVPNDSCAQAQLLERGDAADGFLCGPEGDEDWFGIPVANVGQDVRVVLEHFHFDGNLELELYAPGGETLVGFSYGAGPNFEVIEVEATETGTHCARVFVRTTQIQNGYRILNER